MTPFGRMTGWDSIAENLDHRLPDQVLSHKRVRDAPHPRCYDTLQGWIHADNPMPYHR